MSTKEEADEISKTNRKRNDEEKSRRSQRIEKLENPRKEQHLEVERMRNKIGTGMREREVK